MSRSTAGAGRFGLHIASDLTRAARTSSRLWLEPNRAEKLAQDILAAVAIWLAIGGAIGLSDNSRFLLIPPASLTPRSFPDLVPPPSFSR